MIYIKQHGNVQDSKKIENLNADATKLQDLLQYVAMMSDVELPEEDVDNVQTVEEDA